MKERFTQVSLKIGELTSLVALEDRREGLKLVIFLLRDGTLFLLFDMRCLNTFSITFVHNYQSCLLVSHKFTVDVIHFHKNFFSHF